MAVGAVDNILLLKSESGSKHLGLYMLPGEFRYACAGGRTWCKENPFQHVTAGYGHCSRPNSENVDRCSQCVDNVREVGVREHRLGEISYTV